MTTRKPQTGFTIIELMVAMVLGVVLIGGFVNIFISSQQAFRTNEGLARIQENGRVASELLLREIRQAGATACGTKVVANVLEPGGSTSWWSDWTAGAVRAYDGTFSGVTIGSGTAQRVSGTDVLVLLSTTAMDGVGIDSHNGTAASFKLSTNNHGLEDGDVAMVCDKETAAVFQVTNANSSNDTVVHNTGNTVSPGNCSKGLGYPTVCTTNGNTKTFAGGTMAKFTGSFWYVGNNGRGTQSLYRQTHDNATPQEVVEGVQNFQVDFVTADTTAGNALTAAWQAPASVANWTDTATNRVVAVRVTLTLQSNEAVTTDAQRLQRTFVHVVRLRNREVL
jgi:type IV pilus assembly protein PilW